MNKLNSGTSITGNLGKLIRSHLTFYFTYLKSIYWVPAIYQTLSQISRKQNGIKKREERYRQTTTNSKWIFHNKG
jgi:hypothetical protein